MENFVRKNIDNNNKDMAIFLDVQKAVDCVIIKILFTKLQYAGLRGIPKILLKSFLMGRIQRV